MTDKPDMERMRAAWAIAQQSAQKWRAPIGMIRDRLQKEGFEEATIDAVLRRMLFQTAEANSSAGKKFLKTSLLFVVFGLLFLLLHKLSLIPALSHELFLVTMGVFGLAVVWVGRGLISLGYAAFYRHGAKDMPGPGQGKETKITRDDIRALETRNERLDEARSQVAAFKRLRKRADFAKLIMIAVGVSIVLLGVVYGNILFREYLVYGILLAMAVLLLIPKVFWGIVYLYLLYAEKMAPFPEFNDPATADNEWEDNELSVFKAPSLALADLRSPEQIEVTEAPIISNSPISVSFVRAGNSAKFTFEEVAKEKTGLPAGILLLTTEGLAFFPDASTTDGAIDKDTISNVFNIAKEYVPFAELLGSAGLDYLLDHQEEELPVWVFQAMQHKMHFVIPWVELTDLDLSAKYDMRLTRKAPDSSEETFTVFPMKHGARYFMERLIAERLDSDVRIIRYRNFVKPTFDKTLAALNEKFIQIYGDRVEEHQKEILDECRLQIRTWKNSLGDDIESQWNAQIKSDWAEHFEPYTRYPYLVNERPEILAGPQGAAA
jgi:hypothetical protein